jgi:hypothetical protein
MCIKPLSNGIPIMIAKPFEYVMFSKVYIGVLLAIDVWEVIEKLVWKEW